MIPLIYYNREYLFYTKEGIIYAGNNEDWKDNATMMFFYPSAQKKNGWIKFGWASGFPQGGMNEKGLFWDATSGPHLAMPHSESTKTMFCSDLRFFLTHSMVSEKMKKVG